MGDILEGIKQAMERLAQLPPPPIFAASKLFSPEKAFSFKDGGRDYVVAHPDLFAKLPADRAGVNPLYAIPIHDIDYDDGMRDVVFKALSRAMQDHSDPTP